MNNTPARALPLLFVKAKAMTNAPSVPVGLNVRTVQAAHRGNASGKLLPMKQPNTKGKK